MEYTLKYLCDRMCRDEFIWLVNHSKKDTFVRQYEDVHDYCNE